eukprot:2939316-Rhodomonas_salina.1
MHANTGQRGAQRRQIPGAHLLRRGVPLRTKRRSLTCSPRPLARCWALHWRGRPRACEQHTA